MITYDSFMANLAEVRHRIDTACRLSGRDMKAVALLPVTKNHPEEVLEFVARAQMRAVGENRVQEAIYKRNSYSGPMQWELIGHLQSNKVKLAVENFDRIQSVDSLKLLERLDRSAAEVGKRLPILIQCNAGRDPNKFGFLPEAMEQAVEAALGAECLRLDGFMTIAPLDDNPDVALSAFMKLRELRDHISEGMGCELRELSMGMTGDLEQAIAAGSTQIRVGSALFGARVNASRENP